MSASTNPDRMGPDALWSHLQDESDREPITLRVSVTEDGMFLQTGTVRGQTVVLGPNVAELKHLRIREAYVVTAIFKTFAIGSGQARNYLFCDCVFDVTSVALSSEESGPRTEEFSDESEDKSDTVDGSPFQTGKEIRTDRAGERITGKNPFADPDRLKETGIHQGGV